MDTVKCSTCGMDIGEDELDCPFCEDDYYLDNEDYDRP
jgi:redox-regulated HSP33 family molecular chaperone